MKIPLARNHPAGISPHILPTDQFRFRIDPTFSVRRTRLESLRDNVDRGRIIMKITKQKSPGHYLNALLARLQIGSLHGFYSLRQNLQLALRLPQLIANAIRHGHLDNIETSQEPPSLLEQNHSSKYHTYLCDYRFRGHTYSIDIIATSWEEAEQRLQCIAGNGRIIGGPAFTIKIPFT